MSIDFKKAFDTVSRPFLRALLEVLPFPESFRKFLKLAFTDSSTTVFINDVTWIAFRVCAGVRQGCSLAPSLYTLAAECFLQALRDDGNIRGIMIPGHGESKGAAFADDTVSYLGRPPYVPHLLSLLVRLKKATGLAFHSEKVG